jgi:carboxypeptidase C (cathepsin A)
LFGAIGHNVAIEDEKIPLLVWLQGGPGASSQFGAFTEIGPIQIKDGKPSLRQYSWNTQGHLLFIDNPLNVGFSYNGDRKAEKQVSSAT